MEQRPQFYKESLTEFVKDKSASILVVGGGDNDRDVFMELGFKNVLITNLDSRMKEDDMAPFKWAYQDAHNLTYADRSFDYVVAHATLHHCSSPHRVLLEMYRVAKIGLLVVEPHDSLITDFMKLFNFAQTYEIPAVYDNDCKFGGLNNTDIPNFVFRWTEKEVKKTISAYAPHVICRAKFKYGVDLPGVTTVEKSFLKRWIVMFGAPLYRLFVLFFPKQKNLFSFYVEKPVIPDDLHPWLVLQENNLSFNKEWAKKRYKSQN